VILLISASCTAKIAVISHWHLAQYDFLLELSSKTDIILRSQITNISELCFPLGFSWKRGSKINGGLKRCPDLKNAVIYTLSGTVKT
jgi:hypothetical protein